MNQIEFHLQALFVGNQSSLSNLGDLIQILYDQLCIFDLCADQQNPMLFFELDKNHNLLQIARYDDESIKHYAFKEIESAIYSSLKN